MGKQFVSHAPGYWPDVAPEHWNDWKWQLKNRVTTLAQLEQHLTLSDEERNGVLLSGNEARARRHAALFQPDREGQSELPDSPPGHSARRGKLGVALRHGRSVRRRFAHAGAGFGASLSGSRALSRDRSLRELLPLLHAQPRRQRRGRTGTAHRVRGHLSLSRRAHRSARRAAFRRRRASFQRQQTGRNSETPARDPAHRVRPHRHARPDFPPATHHARALRDAAKISSALDERARQPSARAHHRSESRARDAGQSRHPARQPKRPAREA